jgi:uncharacterized membrane protein
MSSTPLDPVETGTSAHAGATVDPTRMINLSDAVFAIAMTLLVLGLDVPEVAAGRLGATLADMVPQLLAFLLAFGLVAGIWWQHHKLFGRLAHLDRGLVALNLAFLGVVALVPFPTGLLGSHPTSRAGVLPFVAVYALLLALFLGMHARAQYADAWRRPMPAALAPWVMAGWALALLVAVAAGLVVLVSPLAGLAVLVLSNGPEVLIAHLAPEGYRDWA